MLGFRALASERQPCPAHSVIAVHGRRLPWFDHGAPGAAINRHLAGKAGGLDRRQRIFDLLVKGHIADADGDGLERRARGPHGKQERIGIVARSIRVDDEPHQ